MRRFLTITGLTALLLFLPFAVSLQAQAPPTFIAGGALFKNGGPTEFGMQVGLNGNFMQNENTEGNVTSQIYGRGTFFMVDDVSFDTSVAQELEAVSGLVIGEQTFGNFFAALGGGMEIELREGENPIVGALLVEGGWKPWNRARFTLGAQYIPITGSGDLTFTYFGVGLIF